MTLLLRPQLSCSEGPNGYLMRLAEANDLSISDLKGLGILFDKDLLSARGYLGKESAIYAHASRIQCSMDSYPAAWNQVTPRYCPLCLSETGIWQYGWEVNWNDACARHNVWLIDRCAICGHRLTWGRSCLGRCPCGAFINQAVPAACPDSVALLSSLLSSRAIGEEGKHPFTPLNCLSLGQLQRLIRLLGAYGDGGWQPKPQKIHHADWLDVSWQFTSLAAEYLAQGMPGVLHFIQQLYKNSEASNNKQGRMHGRFGHFYSLLYRGFSEPEFLFLRSAFESFVADHWQGAIGRRNRNLPADLLEKLAWIPSALACRQLNISHQTLRMLVLEGRITANERISSKGRRFLIVKRADVENEIALRATYVDMDVAARLLGLKKCRTAKILPWLIPEATKRLGAWEIPSEKIQRLLHLGVGLAIVSDQETDYVSLAFLLQYWSWHDREIAEMFDALLNGAIRPKGRNSEHKGVAGYVFRKADLQDWYRRANPPVATSFSIPEASKLLEIKQEVAYSLVRGGLLPTSQEKIGHRHLTRVSRIGLTEFRDAYVFGRDLAEEMGTSPRALAERLDRLDIRPVSGPSVDGGRQYLYARSSALAVALNAIRFVNCRGTAQTVRN